MRILKDLEVFIAESQKRERFGLNQWLEHDGIKVYVRHSYRNLEGQLLIPCLDIASISVSTRLRRKGRCRRFIEMAHEIHPWKATFIENVLNENLRDAFERWQWTRYTVEGIFDSSFFKLKETK